MEIAFEVSLTKSKGRKEKDVQRKLKSGLGILEPGSKVLIRNMSLSEGPGKLRSFWEQDVAEVIQTHENVTYTIKVISKPEKFGYYTERHLANPSDASESDEQELELTRRQLLQLHSISPQVSKKRQFKLSSRPNLKQKAPKECKS